MKVRDSVTTAGGSRSDEDRAGESPEQGVCREVAEELGVFDYNEVPDLHMPAPYKATIARWRDLVSGSTPPAST